QNSPNDYLLGYEAYPFPPKNYPFLPDPSILSLRIFLVKLTLLPQFHDSFFLKVKLTLIHHSSVLGKTIAAEA
ncbi:hypothetical protein A4A49_52861, partial [Nicotiana attenuata]